MAEKKPKLGSGKRFAAIEEKAEKEGYSKKSSAAIAASAGIKAHGKEKMAELAKKGKERAKKK